MIRVKKIENGMERVMCFTEFDWKRISNLKDSNVRWELLPSDVKVNESKQVVVDVKPLEAAVEKLSAFDEALKSGKLQKRQGGWYFYRGKNLGRLADAVKHFEK